MALSNLLRAIIIASGVILAAPTSGNGYANVGASPELRDNWRIDGPLDLLAMPKWKIAPMLSGHGTTYDAYSHSGAWYDSPNTWLSTDDHGEWLTKASCKEHPEWRCYTKDFGSWSKLVRRWSTTLGDMYGALGPKLRKLIGEQMPAWHTKPLHKVLVTSMSSGLSVEVWVADYCACGGGDKKQNTKDDPLIDLSPQVWAALGAYKNGKSLPNVPGWSNEIQVRFLP